MPPMSTENREYAECAVRELVASVRPDLSNRQIRIEWHQLSNIDPDMGGLAWVRAINGRPFDAVLITCVVHGEGTDRRIDLTVDPISDLLLEKLVACCDPDSESGIYLGQAES